VILMQKYIVRRLLEVIPILLFISIVIFIILNAMPGDALLQMRMENPRSFANDPEALDRLRAHYGLDQPVYVRYGVWLGKMLQGDMGYSSTYRVPVLNLLRSRIPNTLILTVTAWLIGLVVALPIGIYSAIKKYSVFDFMATGFAFVGISLPHFWFALMAIIIFSVHLGWLPISGMSSYGVTGTWDVFIDRFRHLILPACILGFVQVAYWVRYIRTALIEVMNMDYIRTAYSKGITRKKVIFKHALKNALIPIITILALDIPYFFGGAVIVETVFSWPGMGRLMYQAVLGSDHNLAINCLIFLALVTLMSNLMADFLYAFVDPRIRYN